MRKISISITPELDSALTIAALKMKQSKSRLVETILRESSVLRGCIELVRSEPDVTVYAVPHKPKARIRWTVKAVASS